MKSVILLIALIGCAVATPPVVTTLYSGLNRNSLHIQNGPLGSISAELPSLRNVVPALSQLAPLALSLGNLGSLGDSGSLGDLGSLGGLGSLGSLGSLDSLRSLGKLASLGGLESLGNLGSLSDLASLGELASLGARLLPPIPSSVQLRTVPVSIPIPFPSFTPVSYSTRSLVPYPYNIYAGARLY